MPASSAAIDFIEELMYRCWARTHYLPLELRHRDWNPIILEEMAVRDRELAEQEEQEALLNQTKSRGFVPLVPTVTHYVHPAHTEIREPYSLSTGFSSVTLAMNSIHASGVYEFLF